MQTNLFIIPQFRNIENARDILNRISWGLYGREKGTIILYLVGKNSPGGNPSEWIDTSMLAGFLENYLPTLPPILEQGDIQEINVDDFVLFWDYPSYSNFGTKLDSEQKILIDPNFRFNHEADQIAALQHTISTEKQQRAIRDLSKARYAKFLERWKNVKNAHLYLTGPTVETALQHPVDRSAVHFICNSLVKNTKLLQQIQPDVLMFSDPAYHFGISKYASSFRAYVKQAMTNFPGMLCMVPERYYPLTTAFLGEEAGERVIGIPLVEMDDFHFPSVKEFYIKKTANILTAMMIPVASSAAEKINILGADGRANSDKGYWSHAKSSQISDQMKTIYAAHPSMARDEDVEKYYQEHCQLLEAQLKYGEIKQRKDYVCLTPSMIPALADRMISTRLHGKEA